MAVIHTKKRKIKRVITHLKAHLGRRIEGKVVGKYFPNIYRFITEELPWHHVMSLSFLLLLIPSVIYGYHLIGIEKDLLANRSKLQRELVGWKKIARLHPNFRDGYMQVAVISFELGKFEESRAYIQKTLSLDPNYSYAKTFGRLVEIEEFAVNGQ